MSLKNQSMPHCGPSEFYRRYTSGYVTPVPHMMVYMLLNAVELVSPVIVPMAWIVLVAEIGIGLTYNVPLVHVPGVVAVGADPSVV